MSALEGLQSATGVQALFGRAIADQISNAPNGNQASESKGTVGQDTVQISNEAKAAASES